MAINTGKGGVTDYMGKIYAGRLDGPLMRGYMQISMDCCADFGTLACLTCPLEEFVPRCVPGCGMRECERCATRAGCPCGNEKLRNALLEEIGAEIALVGG